MPTDEQISELLNLLFQTHFERVGQGFDPVANVELIDRQRENVRTWLRNTMPHQVGRRN
jgi:hypothetical protein